MSKEYKIKKGLDIKLKGEAEKVLTSLAKLAGTYALKPADFHNVTPKMLVKVGETVKAGQPVFENTYDSQVKFVAPVSGEVIEIKRGERRRILEVIIKTDAQISYKEFTKANSSDLSKEKVTEKLLESGLWTVIRQRPFSIIPSSNSSPKSIFISAFDSSPLAPDYDFVMHGQGEAFQTGLDALAKLGPIQLNVNGGAAQISKVFTNAKNVTINNVSGPHPAGNVGPQINVIDPIKKDEFVWYVNPQDVVTIGKFFLNGKYDSEKIIAIAGSKVSKPKYYKVNAGISISALSNLADKNNARFISGNVLTGTQVCPDSGYLGAYDNLLTVIPEGKEPQLFGWLAPNFHKFSVSRTFFSWLTPNKKYDLNTNLNGEERAFVMSGQYETVFPFNIYPVQLVKAILAGDIEKMEELGIYEVDSEDFALCEFICTSKIESQKIVREGLDLVHKECYS